MTDKVETTLATGNYPSGDMIMVDVTATFDTALPDSVEFTVDGLDASSTFVVSESRKLTTDKKMLASICIYKDMATVPMQSITYNKGDSLKFKITATPTTGGTPGTAFSTADISVTIDDISLIDSSIEKMRPTLLSSPFNTGAALTYTKELPQDNTDKVYFTYQLSCLDAAVKSFNVGGITVSNIDEVQQLRVFRESVTTATPPTTVLTELMPVKKLAKGAASTEEYMLFFPVPYDTNGCTLRFYPTDQADPKAFVINPATQYYGTAGTLVAGQQSVYTVDMNAINITLYPPELENLSSGTITYNPNRTYEGASIHSYIGRKPKDLVIPYCNKLGDKSLHFLETSTASDISMLTYAIHVPYALMAEGSNNQLSYLIFDGTSLSRSESLMFKFTGLTADPDQPPAGHNRKIKMPKLEWRPNDTANYESVGANGTEKHEIINPTMQATGDFKLTIYIDSKLVKVNDNLKVSMYINAHDVNGLTNKQLITINGGTVTQTVLTAGTLELVINNNIFYGYDSDGYDHPGKVWIEIGYNTSSQNLYSETWWGYIDTVAPTAY